MHTNKLVRKYQKTKQLFFVRYRTWSFPILRKIAKHDVGHFGNLHNWGFLDSSYFPLFGVTRKGVICYPSRIHVTDVARHHHGADKKNEN